MSKFQTTPTMWEFMSDQRFVRAIAGPIGCLAGETLVVTEQGPRRIDALDRPTRVLSWDETLGRFRFAPASASFPKGTDALYRVRVPHGEWRAAGHHRVLCADGTYRQVQELAQPGSSSALLCCAFQPGTPDSPGLKSWRAGARRWSQTAAGWLGRCGSLFHQYDPQPPLGVGIGPVPAPSLPGALKYGSDLWPAARTHPGQPSDRQPMLGSALQEAAPRAGAGCAGSWPRLSALWQQCSQAALRSGFWIKFRPLWRQLVGQTGSYSYSLHDEAIVSLTRETSQEVYWDLQVPNTNNYVTVDGTIHHNSGKSVCCSHELVRLALNQAPNAEGLRKTRALIVRNTFDQLRSTTMKTFMDWFQHGQWGIYKASEKTFYMDMGLPDGTQVKAEFMFTPLDAPDDVRKALSLELTTLWINEWREIHPDVVDGLLMRLRRYPSMKDGGFTRSCAIFDTNMPDIDSWHFQKMENPPDNWAVYTQPPAILSYEEYTLQEGEEPDPDLGTKDSLGVPWWVNPRADNLANLDPEYYPGVIPGKTQDFTDVYLRCRYGRSLSGIPVFDKTFNPDFHIADTPFIPLKSEQYPIIVGLDFGRTPATALLQRNAFGQLVVLAELVSTNMGIETFLSKKLQPLLAQSEYAGCHVVVAPDPAGWAKQQIGEVSPVDVVKRAGFHVVKPVTNNPRRRIEAVERVLARHIDGKPAFIVNPACTNTVKAFRYGYRYGVDKKGEQGNDPVKNAHSHVMDGLQYGVLIAEAGATGSVFTNTRREVVPASVSSLAWT